MSDEKLASHGHCGKDIHLPINVCSGKILLSTPTDIESLKLGQVPRRNHWMVEVDKSLIDPYKIFSQNNNS